MITALMSLLRTRKAGTSRVLAVADRPVRRVRDRRPPITALRVACRFLHGFGPPLAENAAIVAALRAGGWPAQLVIGAEPLPAENGRRQVHAWIEIDGQAAGTYLAADAYLVDLARFPVTA